MNAVQDLLNKTSTPRWSKPTRWLHALIALSVTIQLLLSLTMVPPDKLNGASTLEKFSMESHEWVGLIAAGLLFTHWVWLLMSNSDVKLRNLFPWTSSGLRRIGTEVSYLIQNKKLPPAGEHGGVSGLIHGLGLLVASGMTLTGVGLYAVMDYTQGGFENPLFEQIAGIHSLLGNLMWVYLVGHFLAALWHEYLGDRIIAQMFRP